MTTSKRTAWKSLITLQRDALHAMFRRKAQDVDPSDVEGRRRELARAAVRGGGTLWRARLRSLFAGKRKRAQIREEATKRAAEDLALTMGKMKGLAMKFGQFYSFAGGLSRTAERELEHLQSAAPPMGFDVVQAVIEQELGDRAMRRFSHFETKPIASASVGQVHRARLLDGTPVAVKVQYPGIEDAILADFDNIALLTRAYAVTRVDFDMEAILADLLAMMKDEFDYELELRNQAHFADRYRGHPFVRIPEVLPELSARRVLTSEWIEGRRLSDVLEDPQEARDRYAEIIYRFAWRSMRSGVFTCDPHPGNYLFDAEGRVCFLDFGFVKRMESAAQSDQILAPTRAALAGDDAALAASLEALGLVPQRGKAKPDRLWDELRPLYCGPVDHEGRVALDAETYNKAVRVAQRPTAEFYKCRKATHQPPWLSMVLRYTMGTQGVLAHLEANLDWRRLAAELVRDEAVSTEIGSRWGEAPFAAGEAA